MLLINAQIYRSTCLNKHQSSCDLLNKSLSIILMFLNLILFSDLWNTYGECENYAIMKGHTGAIMELQFNADGTLVFQTQYFIL